MTRTASNRAKHDAGPAVVLFGLGDDGKPRAAYFPAAHAELAIKAAGLMGLTAVNVASPELGELAAKLPAGRIHANGRGFVPFIRKDLYGKLAELAKPADGQTEPAAVSLATQPGSQQAGPASPAAPSSSTSSGLPGLPKDWDQIDVGDLVLAQEADPEDGWWEAIVAEKNGDMVTLRWRHYPRLRRVLRHRLNLARLCPAGTADTTAHCTAPAPAAGPPKVSGEKGSAAKSGSAGTDRYPVGWDAIGVDQVVLAKAEGPWEAWWEAIIAEVSGDTLTMRWRNRPHLLPIIRHRSHLALLRPKAE
jgi:hypothetical protein